MIKIIAYSILIYVILSIVNWVINQIINADVYDDPDMEM